jgi:hypothetical protein
VGNPGGKRPRRKPNCRRVDNIKMHLGEIGWGAVDLIGLAVDKDKWRALVNAVMNLRVIEWPLEYCPAPKTVIKLGT